MKLSAISILFGLLSSAAVHADILVITHVSSPLGTLSRDEVGRIFLKRLKRLPEHDSVELTPVGQSSSPALEHAFYLHVTEKDKYQLRAYWARLLFTGKDKPPKALTDDAAVKQWVAEHPGGIGFIREGALTREFKVLYRVPASID